VNPNAPVHRCNRCGAHVNASPDKIRARLVTLGARTFFCDRCYLHFGATLGTDAGDLAAVQRHVDGVMLNSVYAAGDADAGGGEVSIRGLDERVALARTRLDAELRALEAARRRSVEATNEHDRRVSAATAAGQVSHAAQEVVAAAQRNAETATAELGQALHTLEATRERQIRRRAASETKKDAAPRLDLDTRSIDAVQLAWDNPFGSPRKDRTP
jgi:hypothetical protein